MPDLVFFKSEAMRSRLKVKVTGKGQKMTKKTQSPFLYSDESLAYFVDVEYTGISIYSLLYDSPDIVATYEKRAYIRKMQLSGISKGNLLSC